MKGNVKVELRNVQETLLLPLWGRAVETMKQNPRLIDEKAVDIIESLDYDFSTIVENISSVTQVSWIARSIHVDNMIKDFVERNPRATIVDIGCGLDTTFERMKDDRAQFYDLDLPEVIDLRKKFFKEHERRKMIPSSFLDTKWFDELAAGNGILFVAAGVFYYFQEEQVKRFFTSICAKFARCEVFFDVASPLGVKVANKRVIEDGGMEASANLKWGIENPKVIEKWDKRIKVVEEFPMFRGMKKGYSFKTKYGLWMSDFLRIMSMVHLRIKV